MTDRPGSSPSLTDSSMTVPRPEPHIRMWMHLASWLCSKRPAAESVSTSVFFEASPEEVWRRLLSYEEVPSRPPFILRALLPLPLRTEGDKTCVGAAVQCLYGGGDLVKQITVVEPPCLLEFKVLLQRLGIENCITAIGGSYRLRSCRKQTEIELVTNYVGYLRPRAFWRPVERFLGHIFHRHILAGMRDWLPPLPSDLPAIAESSMSKGVSSQEPTCTTLL